MPAGNVGHYNNFSEDVSRLASIRSNNAKRESKNGAASILIVDNDLNNLHCLSLLLQREHYFVRVESSGEVALRTIQAAPPDLILLDVRMSGMNGFEVCTALKRSPQTREIPILFISASDQIEDKVKGFEVGGADYITKPFQLMEVLMRVRHQLELRTLQKQLQTQNIELEQEIQTRQQAEERYCDIVATLRQREAELDQTSRFLDSIIETMPMAVFAKDVQHEFRYVLWNRAAEEIYGIGRQQALGHTLHELVNPAFADHLAQEHESLIENRQLMIADERFQSDFQGEIWQRIRKLPLVNQQGQVTHLLYLAEDITEYKRLEAELKQTEDKYRSIVENAVDGIFQTSPTGDFLSANLALAKMYGYDSPEEMLALLKNTRQLYVSPDERDRFVAEIQLTGIVSHFEVEIYCKDGSTIWVEENAREVRNLQGHLLYYEGTVTDITRRRQAEVALRLEKEKSERLLLNILPESIADRLKHDNSAIAESYEEVSILFADIVGFTSLAAQMQPIEIVNLLNHLFSEFDQLVDQYQLEKIKTIGDAYMVAAGLPIPRKDHAAAIAQLALDMQATVENFATGTGQPLQLRIGINSGVVIAGVIGTRKFIYDLWGDTVNIASRMESQGEAGKIQVTEATCRLICDRYSLVPRGYTAIKGRGTMPTYWLQAATGWKQLSPVSTL